eukprot:g40154.t1
MYGDPCITNTYITYLANSNGTHAGVHREENNPNTAGSFLSSDVFTVNDTFHSYNAVFICKDKRPKQKSMGGSLSRRRDSADSSLAAAAAASAALDQPADIRGSLVDEEEAAHQKKQESPSK